MLTASSGASRSASNATASRPNAVCVSQYRGAFNNIGANWEPVAGVEIEGNIARPATTEPDWLAAVAPGFGALVQHNSCRPTIPATATMIDASRPVRSSIWH
jgi:hypothetical protein